MTSASVMARQRRRLSRDFGSVNELDSDCVLLEESDIGFQFSRTARETSPKRERLFEVLVQNLRLLGD